ncbi:Apurinic-apyrimidinic endonuclease 1 [Hyphodiscus hymeniophilus]|uniref:Apurinic-apyrimidinic endonuclease 1 n=1 Tax=Hyphodiscus hymeniophilus TaxID=353542 RepID=A0A9P6VNC7_9HELO|nr:Apurinic-apyrimidinic endonuclease 1 [Hyphodiscus hymeniophilus]
MPRRLSRKNDNQNTEALPPDTVATPKKGRASVKVEHTEIVTKSPNKSTKKKVKKENLYEEIDIEQRQESVGIKINRVKAKVVLEEEIAPRQTPSTKRKSKAIDEDEEGAGNAEGKKPTKKRKTKEEKEAEAMPLAARTAVGGLKKAMHIGAHVSAAGGVHNSIQNALHIGGNAFALFLKSQRKWLSPATAPEARDQFKSFCLEHKYDAIKHVLPHGSYLVNLAQADAEKAEQAYDCFLDDLQRCEALGIQLYNFHPGSTGKHPRPESIGRIATQLNKAHKATSNVITVLENMAGSGNVIGSTWEDLRDIIALIDDKSRVGVCIDTCHTFAAGYDLRSPEAFKKTMDSFANVVGMQYLKALHLNDSKAPLSSNRDLHANIGTGFLGLRAFHNVVNFSSLQGLPMVLETPIDKKGPDGKVVEDKNVWATEIKLLEGLIGTDAESEDFKREEQRLQDVGAEERKKFQSQVDKKQQRTLDSMLKKASPKKKTKAKKNDDDDNFDASEGGCSH